MHTLGSTRSRSNRDHLLQTPDTFVRTPLSCLDRALAIIHIAPAAGAAFAQYTVEFETGGLMRSSGFERFVYVLDGELTLDFAGEQPLLAKGSYAYLPASQEHRLHAIGRARAAVIELPDRTSERPLEDLGAGTIEPRASLLLGREAAISPTSLLDDPSIQVRSLVPENRAFRFAVNTMTYDPGASLSMVEVHVMEHGLLMLEGGGIYRLSSNWYPVAAGDFIWMAPFCPQWFGALGKTPAKYLIYKDWNRHPIG